MVGTKGHSGGARPNAGGARENAGRPPGSGDGTLSAARLIHLHRSASSPKKFWPMLSACLRFWSTSRSTAIVEPLVLLLPAKLSTEHFAKRRSMSMSQRCVTLRSSTGRRNQQSADGRGRTQSPARPEGRGRRQ